MTQVIALISLAIFIVITIVVGIRSTHKASTLEGFLLGGRNIGPWLTAFAYGTTYFSAVIFIGYAGMFGWTVGIGSVWIGIGNAILGSFLAWIILAKKTRRMTHKLDARTMPELFANRYQSKNMKIYSATLIFIFLVPYAASVYKGLGILFSSIFWGAPPIVVMAIVATLTGIYLVLGGYIATAINDLIQGIVMIIGIVCMVIILLRQPEVQGFSGVYQNLSQMGSELTSIFGGSKWKILLTNILLTSFGTWGLPQMVHKYYAIKDESSIKIATIVSTAFALIIGCGAYFTGSLSRLFIAANPDGSPNSPQGFDSVIPDMLMNTLTGNVFSTIILSLIMVLLLSASMSTLSALVLTSSSAVSIDLVQEIKPSIHPKKQINLMRGLCLLFVLLSFLFATMNISFIVNLMSFSWGVVAGSFIGPYIWGLYNKKITKIGAWAGLLSGLLVVGGSLIFISFNQGFELAKSFAPQMGVAAMIVSMIATPVLSLFTKKYDEKHLREVFE